MQGCTTSGILAFIAIVLLAIGLSRDENSSRRSTTAWKYIDAASQVISLILAYQLIIGGTALAAAAGAILILVAAAVGYGHYSGAKNTNPVWNYADGADMALWGSVFLADLAL